VAVEVSMVDARFVHGHVVITDSTRDQHDEEQEQSRSTERCIDEHLAQNLGPDLYRSTATMAARP
jgi:hypothetical protein